MTELSHTANALDVTEAPDDSLAVDDLKARHRAVWAMGDYPAVAADVIPDLGATLVEACGIGPGDKVLDVACGSGNAAIPAALAGASVMACDLTPRLLEAGRSLAARRGARLQWRQGDAEALPFDDGEFDVVLSCVGVMFAPHHRASADELIRVCRPGGTVGLLSWTPEGFVGEMFSTMKPHSPPPPTGTDPPPLWGDEDHVRKLLGSSVTSFSARRDAVTVDCFDDAEAFCDYFKHNYGPTVATYRSLEQDPGRTAALDLDLCQLARRHDKGEGTTVMEWEYLVVTAQKTC